MEKLIELLNEYEKIKENSEYIQFRWSKTYKGDIVRYDDYDQREGDNLQNDTATTYLISKDFGFIKWLVENYKINLLRLDNRIALSEFNKVERVLMALSISDTPIEDLISYLK